MRKSYKLQDLDCANCGAKMEERIKKIDGVKDARVNFMLQKLTIDAEESCIEAILDEAQRVVRSVEPDCSIVR